MIRVRPAHLLFLSLALVPCLGAIPEFYSTRPPFEQPIPLQYTPEGLDGISAKQCGVCHQQIYREWQQSVHAQAWPDPQFQAELKKQPGVSWLCVNCHTPLRNQLDSLVVGLIDDDVERPVKQANPKFEPELKKEGVTCASCHVRDGVVEGPYKEVDAPHEVRYNPAFRSAELCARCHQAVQSYPGKNFICTFTTGDEWAAGPFAKKGTVCQDCHMPAVTRPLAEGTTPRRVGRHGWMASHLRKGGETEPALWHTLAGLAPVGVQLKPGPAPAARAGAQALWKVRAVNARAGHNLPSGDPERAVIVHLFALGARGDTLAQAEERIGQSYQWYPVVKLLSDTRLKPGEGRDVVMRFKVPRGPYRLVARAVNERISDANAGYHRLPDSYERRREVARVELKGMGR